MVQEKRRNTEAQHLEGTIEKSQTAAWTWLCRMFFMILGCHRSWKAGAQISTWLATHFTSLNFNFSVPFLQGECQVHLEWVSKEPSTALGPYLLLAPFSLHLFPRASS